MSKKVIGIWAQTKNGVIGKDQVMPWHLPAELQHFKQTTTGHAILMGRVTYEGLNKRVLPNRTNIILSRDDKYDVENETVLLKTSVEDVLNWYKSQDLSLFIIGGEKVIRLFEPCLEELYQTVIDAELEGDTYFPENFQWDQFQLVDERTIEKDEKNSYDFTIRHFERKEDQFMERSIFGFFTAVLCVICLVCASQTLRKKRYGLATLFLLNAFTNLVNSIHAFYMTLFK